MNEKLVLRTRREFLRATVLGSAFSWTVPSFLAQTFDALHAESADKRTQATTGKDGTILVVVQMAGGNDGLNTVVPFQNDHYRRARPRLALSADDVLKLNDELGLHPSLAGFKELFDQGHLSIVQGVGYPNPNRSHFRSTEIWQTAADSSRMEPYGWIGRFFDNACKGADPTIGISVGPQLPQAFAGPKPMGVSLMNPENYRFSTVDEPKKDAPNSTDHFYRLLNQTPANEEMAHEMDSGASIGRLSGRTPAHPRALDYLERVALDAQVSSDKIIAISKKVANQASYPASPLANSLRLVSRLIGGGLPTRIYYVSQGGYDTHTNQSGTQQRLLKDLAESMRAFTADLRAQGNLQRVLVMTFSEFGRRVAENANGGTDHGAAAPMFLIGDKLKSGLAGQYPSLAPEHLLNGDIQYTVDFRSVYAAVLEQWLKTDSEKILGRKLAALPLVAS